jgi:hypothetical protein
MTQPTKHCTPIMHSKMDFHAFKIGCFLAKFGAEMTSLFAIYTM